MSKVYVVLAENCGRFLETKVIAAFATRKEARDFVIAKNATPGRRTYYYTSAKLGAQP
jgi:hypothetical protein